MHSPLSFLPNGKNRLEPQGEISKWILDSNTENVEGYMKLLRFLQYKLRMEKKKKSYSPFIESNPIVRRCDHCGKRPVIYKWEYANETDRICSICSKKRFHGEKYSVLEELGKKDDFWYNYQGEMPRDLDTLAGSSGNIGIIYADGNEMGKILFESEDLSQFKSTSKKIEDSIFDSLNPLLKKYAHSDALPFELLNKAGDDIIMIIQAEYILEFSLELLSEFEKICSENLDDTITMALGATIFKAKYPVQYAFEITKSLLRSAKRVSKQDIDKPKSAISYLYMKSPIAASSCEEIIHSYYTVSDDIFLTMRPYTCDEFKLLLEIAKEIKENKILTNSQIGAISRAFEQKSLYSTMNFTKYQISRIKKEKRKSLLRIINNLKDKFDLEDIDESDELPLWGKRVFNGKEVTATPLLDIFEILEISGGGLFE